MTEGERAWPAGEADTDRVQAAYLPGQQCEARVAPQRFVERSAGSKYLDQANFLKNYVRYLREKIEDDPTHPSYIHTQWGVGYLMPD
ncbi:MAG TPA: helix-turn-helix domain-containing protein [Anaerolineae bacterium]|nr:helix-turn-helix domain-containing protein [Anaerolineae bacterium]